jgi:hypothetical protein
VTQACRRIGCPVYWIMSGVSDDVRCIGCVKVLKYGSVVRCVETVRVLSCWGVGVVSGALPFVVGV